MSSNSEYLDGIPTTPNTVSDSWQPAVEQIDTTKKGFNAVSLGNWDNGTTKPTVLAGSEIEAAGGVVRVSTDETILDDPGGISSGILYLVVDFSGSNPEWYFTNDAPVWNASLYGYYDAASGSVNWKYTGHVVTFDGSSSYFGKGFFDGTQEGINGIRSNIGAVVYSTDSVCTSGNNGYTYYGDGTKLLTIGRGGLDNKSATVSTTTSTTFVKCAEFVSVASGTSKIEVIIGLSGGSQTQLELRLNGSAVWTVNSTGSADQSFTNTITTGPGNIYEIFYRLQSGTSAAFSAVALGASSVSLEMIHNGNGRIGPA